MESEGLKPIKIDKIDKLILNELRKDSKRSFRKMAKRISISPQKLHFRVQRLIDNKAITGFPAIIDYAKLGYLNHGALIQLARLSDKEKQGFLSYLISMPEIVFLANCAGNSDLILSAITKSSVEFVEIFRKIEEKSPNYIRNFESSLYLGINFFARFYEHDEETMPIFYGGKPSMIILDDIDKKLLSLLSQNCRLSTVELALKLSLSSDTVKERIKKLEKSGIIIGYTVSIENKVIGFENYEVMVKLQNMTFQKQKEILSFCQQKSNIQFLINFLGNWDLDIVINVRNNDELQAIIVEFRDRFYDVIKNMEQIRVVSTPKWVTCPKLL